MYLHCVVLTVPSVRSECQMSLLKFLLSILVSYSQPATNLCPGVGTCFSFTPVAVACHELAVTLSMWSGIHIHLIFYHVVDSLGKKKIKNPKPLSQKVCSCICVHNLYGEISSLKTHKKGIFKLFLKLCFTEIYRIIC